MALVIRCSGLVAVLLMLWQGEVFGAEKVDRLIQSLLIYSDSGVGLEVDDPGKVRVGVEFLNEEAKRIGLTRDLIQTKTELQLRRNSIIPMKKRDDGALYINITVVKNAYNLRVEFIRQVYYQARGKLHVKLCVAWGRGHVGTHSDDKSFILEGLSEAVDEFINEFQKANPPAKKVRTPRSSIRGPSTLSRHLHVLPPASSCGDVEQSRYVASGAGVGASHDHGQPGGHPTQD